MDQAALFSSFLLKEAPTTRAVIARIPEGSDYRPDPKSRTAREIAWLIATELAVLVEGLEKGEFDWRDTPAPATVAEVVDVVDGAHAGIDARLAAVKTWDEPLPFKVEGREVTRTTGLEMAWGILFDLIHHRGQITAYLRPMGAKVPQIYGPSADEPM